VVSRTVDLQAERSGMFTTVENYMYSIKDVIDDLRCWEFDACEPSILNDFDSWFEWAMAKHSGGQSAYLYKTFREMREKMALRFTHDIERRMSEIIIRSRFDFPVIVSPRSILLCSL